VLFSLACRKDSTAYKYFDLSHLHSAGVKPGECSGRDCGNLVESMGKSGPPQGVIAACIVLELGPGSRFETNG
jgi:hypothetical protein